MVFGVVGREELGKNDRAILLEPRNEMRRLAPQDGVALLKELEVDRDAHPCRLVRALEDVRCLVEHLGPAWMRWKHRILEVALVPTMLFAEPREEMQDRSA